METSGPNDEVVKVMPPLTITDDELAKGLDLLSDSVRAVCAT
jgi:diaminobutyrate-2-oxoglutarate transaminase